MNTLQFKTLLLNSFAKWQGKWQLFCN